MTKRAKVEFQGMLIAATLGAILGAGIGAAVEAARWSFIAYVGPCFEDGSGTCVTVRVR